MPPMKRRMGDGDVADIAGLMGPLGIPGAVAGVLAKVGKQLVDPKIIKQLDDLLGQTLLAGKRTFRLSSFNPEKGIARLHDIESGERIASKLDDLVRRLEDFSYVPGIPAPLGEGVTKASVSSGERFLKYPKALAAPTLAGERIPDISTLGPLGGVSRHDLTPRIAPVKRRIPKTATK